MLKAIETLVNHSGRSKTVGNHSREKLTTCTHYYYHNTCICSVNDAAREFELPYDGMYSGSVSTRRAVNDYRRYFSGLGYTCTNDAARAV